MEEIFTVELEKIFDDEKFDRMNLKNFVILIFYRIKLKIKIHR